MQILIFLKEQKECNKDISETRVDLANLERLEKETSGDYTKFLLDETARLEKEFKRLCDVENCNIFVNLYALATVLL